MKSAIRLIIIIYSNKSIFDIKPVVKDRLNLKFQPVNRLDVLRNFNNSISIDLTATLTVKFTLVKYLNSGRILTTVNLTTIFFMD